MFGKIISPLFQCKTDNQLLPFNYTLNCVLLIVWNL